MRRGQVAIVVPQRIVDDVGDDRRARADRRPCRTTRPWARSRRRRWPSCRPPAGSARRRAADGPRPRRAAGRNRRSRLSCDSTRRTRRSSTSSSGALIAIISRICACPSRSASASLRSVMSRETPTTPKISLRSLRSGTFVVEKPACSPEPSMTRSSWSIIGCPLRMIFCSSAKNCRAISGGRRSKSVLPISSLGAGDADADRRGLVGDDEAAVDVLDPEVVGQPVDQRLQRKALVRRGARGLELGDVLVSDDPAAARHRHASHLDVPAVPQLGHPVRSILRRNDWPDKTTDSRRPPSPTFLRRREVRRFRAVSRPGEVARGPAGRSRRSADC